MRNLYDVIDQIKEQLPLPEKEELHRELVGVQVSLTYASPEELESALWWNRAYDALILHLPKPTPSELNEWQKAVIRIWMDLGEDDEI